MSKTVPDIDNTAVGFNDDAATDTPTNPPGWNELTVTVAGIQTTFTRSVETDSDGNSVVSVEADCDDPSMLLLARKGDADYWNGDTWAKDHPNRRLWCADITAAMLRQGLVAADPHWNGEGPQTAMFAAGHVHYTSTLGAHGLTAVIAQIRGVRLLQTMAPAGRWKTTLGGYIVPLEIHRLMSDSFNDISRVYDGLPQPPWDHTPWGPQPVAGCAAGKFADEPRVFVGEHTDLIWRALTETDHGGMSPLKEGVLRYGSPGLVTAAVLYDTKAQQQITSGLFDGVKQRDRATIRTRALETFADELNPRDKPCRWTAEQQTQIRGFIKTVETLEP